MKHSLLTTLLVATMVSAGAFCANAESPAFPEHPDFEHQMNREEMHKKMTDKMATELGLTDKQKAEAKAIHEKGKADMEPLMNDMKDLREKMDTKRRTNMEEFEKILTPEQKQKFEEMKKNALRHKKGDKKHHRKFGGAPLGDKAPADFEVQDGE